MKIYYDKDASLPLVKRKKVAIVGYGSQGHAHANNLRDSGVPVVVAARQGGASWNKAKKAGFDVAAPADAAAAADVVMLLLPDEEHAAVYRNELRDNLKKGATLGFAHGFNIHFNLITPREDLGVMMVAPKGPGHLVRSTYAGGGGVPCLIAVGAGGDSVRKLALAYASAIGGGRAGIIQTTFRDETETDLFGEQAVLCGGLTALVQAGYDTLVEAGYEPEMAYFECLHELKLIVDLMYEGGIANMRYSISNTAEYGDITRGPRLITDETRAEMRRILAEVQEGKFAGEFVRECMSGAPQISAMRRRAAEHDIEKVGAKLRRMMPWIGKNRLVDKSKN